jgi:hypothetical protein
MLAAATSVSAVEVPDIHGLHNGKKEVKHFPHKKHADEFVKGKQDWAEFKYTDDWTCAACHHKTKKGETPKKCISCKDEMSGGKLKKFMHANCKDGCHKKSGEKKLTKCKNCHG